jgi:hypothetical protein
MRRYAIVPLLALVLVATPLLASDADAQAAARPAGAQRLTSTVVDLRIVSDGRPMAPWLKWGLVGAGAGAVAFALLGQARVDGKPNPVLQDAAVGAVIGFAVVGGAVAFYSWVCSPDSRSRRAGLCGR